MQSLKYKLLLNKDSSFFFSSSLVHDLGFQFFFDSITGIHPDETNLSTRLSWSLHKKTSITFSSEISSRVLNNFDYITDIQGSTAKVISSSFMTPLILIFSFGLGHSWQGFGDLNLGLSSAKFTYIRDRSIFEKLNVTEFYGIQKGRNHLFEYGLSLHILVDNELLKKVHWNCDLLFFKNYQSPVDISMKNLFCINVNKFIKTSIQTRILYEEKISKTLQIENYITIGFSVHL